MNRAYARLESKALQETPDAYIITGIASTPRTDRMGDVVDPLGARFDALPKLFLHHDTRLPIGGLTEATPGAKGIPFQARIPKVSEPGVVKDRIDEAVHSIKYDLLSYVSIGFMPIESEPIDAKNPYFGGTNFKEWDWFELSVVGVPANPDAVITGIKSIDDELHLARITQSKSIDSQQRAASGNAQQRRVVHLTDQPGASGTQSDIPKGTEVKTIAEQIASFEAKRAASAARRDEVQNKAIEAGRSKDAAEREEFDNLTAEIDNIDAELKDLRVIERQAVAKATPVTKAVGEDSAAASAARGGIAEGRITHVQANIEKGVPFVRYVKAMILAKGIPMLALQIAQANKQWMDQTPEVAHVLKTAVAAGDTTTAGWAAELVYNQNLTSAFLEYLRPMSILGKIPGFTMVPFNVRWGTQTGGATGYWAGQGKPAPVSALATGSDSLGIAKAVGMVVLSKELMMSSDPSAEVLSRNDLAKTISQFLDVNFIAPDYAAVANVNPASVTNGVVPTAASGTAASNLVTDVNTLFNNFDVNNLEGGGFFWVTTPKIARAISNMRTTLGAFLYPTVTPEGGTFFGYPLIVSGSAMQVGSPVSGEGNLLVLGHAPSIAMADAGGVTIDASEEAALQMLDNPTNASTGGTVATTMVSMWQTNSVALRATRFINWSKRRSFAVQYIKDAAYVA